MITAERLEELIKQGATIYSINDYAVAEIDLADEIAEVCGDTLYYQDGIWCYIKDLFETIEQAGWASKTLAERTERFEPPMWDEIEDDYLYKFYINQKEFKFYINKFTDCVYIYNLDDTQVVYDVFDEPVTKENYIKACEIVRDLFNKGGVK